MNENKVNYQAQIEDELDLLEIAAKLWKKKWTIILLTALPTLLIIMFAIFKMERVDLYKATVTIDSYQEKGNNNNYYTNLIKSIVYGKNFLEGIKQKYPNLSLENFKFSFDNKKLKDQQQIYISVISPDQEIVAPAANFATIVIQQILNKYYSDLISQMEEKRVLQKKSINDYQNSLKILEKKITKIKNQKDAEFLLSLVSSLNNSLANINKTVIFDYSKIKTLSKATRPTLSISAEKKLSDKRKKALSTSRWKSKKIIVIVTFFSFLFLSIMLVLLLDFIKNNKEKFKDYLSE